MTNDYTPSKEDKLPAFESPYPGFGGVLSDHEVRFIESYGHACAEHARAPLLARIAELEAERSASVIEWEPGRSYTAAELLRRAIRGLRVRKDHDLWPAVRNMCGVGSTVAHYLCRWAGRDPDTGQEIVARPTPEKNNA